MFGGIKMTEIKEQLSQLNKMSNKSEALYHKVAFAMVFSITHCCVNFIKASCYSI